MPDPLSPGKPSGVAPFGVDPLTGFRRAGASSGSARHQARSPGQRVAVIVTTGVEAMARKSSASGKRESQDPKQAAQADPRPTAEDGRQGARIAVGAAIGSAAIAAALIYYNRSKTSA
jgi:hypothetical protein